MIDGSGKRNRQSAFELQNSHVCEKRSNESAGRVIYEIRHTLKLSYSCMPNMKSVISSHKYVLSNFNSPTQQPDTCNCRKKPDCPLEEKCLQSNVTYQASVTTATTTEIYFRLATNLMERNRNHQSFFLTLEQKK